MFCTGCGAQFNTAAVFCEDCGSTKESLANGRYRVTGLVTRKSSGVGLRARDNVLDREVFIKVFSSMTMGKNAEDRFAVMGGGEL